jgi:hypothetical protein
MRSFYLLTALSVLAYASAASADNLPPVPGTVTATVTATVAEPKVEKTEAKTEAKTITSFRLHEVAPSVCGPAAHLPPVTAPASSLPPACGPAKHLPKACGPVAKLPPACGPATQLPVCDKVAKHECKKVLEKSALFVTNTLVRKPVYDVEKVLWEAEDCRLNKENSRLDKEANELMTKSEKLAEKIKATDQNDLHAKLVLAKEQRAYSAQTNNLAVRRAALELKQAEHAELGKKLDAKHMKLFHNAG